MSQVYTYEVRDGIAWVVLNRPEQINAINDELRRGIIDSIERAEADANVRVVVLMGSGTRGFCAGADINEARAPETPAEARRRLERHSYIDAIAQCSKPTIAAIHGVCMGGGFEIALACDIRIAASDALFALPETGLGLIPGGGGTQRLPRVIGLGRALDLMLTGERIDAAEALRIGAVSRLVADSGQLAAEAEKVAQKIAAKPPIASTYAKEAARSGFDMDIRSGLQLERTLFTVLLSTEDRREAVAAFKEKRRPRFSGR